MTLREEVGSKRWKLTGYLIIIFLCMQRVLMYLYIIHKIHELQLGSVLGLKKIGKKE